ncbi:MAG TPA: HAD family phosphatase [Ktedonobacterales bacterium]
MVRGAILDVDGTLVLSNDAHARAWVLACAEYGYSVPFDRIRALIGMRGDRLLAQVKRGLRENEGDGQQIAERRKEIFLTRYADTLEPAPGARTLVCQLRDAGVRMAIASSAKPDELDRLLRAAHVSDILSSADAVSDVAASKPAPDSMRKALDQLALAPTEVVAIGDTPYDIEAARASGIGAIALRCGGFSDAALAGALAIYDDPADLAAHYAESALGAGPINTAAPPDAPGQHASG